MSRANLASLDLVEDIPVLLDRLAHREKDAPPFFARYWYDSQDRLQIAFTEAQ